mmetsp:Transcript_5035/g.10660  ORF Transcript_5035/g.10660 Transcript_5035/m.10660 type:complete len:280 (-) Transcript_5035:318-1157(-)|eukprot:CAMPEP_0185844454 /NCGR_PEP_ID=MMETSP1354-20130828/616_1 /TAXON_ID=708628 /ORGANISM="Erythrolobus madagascarensis, Strain CCMP3276" /LENGTH=279 /DNA_ID=CAMNT_0028544121 /DNA_START=24 /DNA_END=863 /DNA_ORIENTATION=+
MAFAVTVGFSVARTMRDGACSVKNAVPESALSRRVKISPVIMSAGAAHGGETAKTKADPASERRPGSHKGFVEEMRFVAMRLHTKDQAPREGKMEESALPIQEWRPRKEDYLQFLVDSLAVYSYLEEKMIESNSEMLATFANTGLERTGALKKDIEWFEMQGFTSPAPTKAATNYVKYLESIVEERPGAFLCHWYNYYFAHSAGGRMIGRMMSEMLFEGKELEFYRWDRDVKEILGEVRERIDAVAKPWPRDVKDECLNETSMAFAYSGTVLQNLAKKG